MVEYRIETKADLKKVYDIYKHLLKDDATWHFTLEDTYIEFRIDTYLPAMDKYLKAHHYKYTQFNYVDNIPQTRRHQIAFEAIFHGYAILSMQLYETKFKDKEAKSKEIDAVLERCFHLVCNALNIDLVEEAKRLGNLTVNRFYTAGYFTSQKKYQTKIDKFIKKCKGEGGKDGRVSKHK